MSIELRETPVLSPRNPLDSLKGALINAPVMAFLSKFDAYIKKKERTLTK